MSLTADEFLHDVAAVFIGDTKGSFGSGRLIAPGLVLTSGHVVDYPTRSQALSTGWKVSLLGERTADGLWKNSAHAAKVVWRGLGDLDLALLELLGTAKPTPTPKPVFASYERLGSIAEVEAAGFPEAWFVDDNEDPRGGKILRDYIVDGSLRVATQYGPYTWTVAYSNNPDDPHGWKGMSGAGVCHVGADNKLYLFGVVQEVPPNFSGLLEVARISDAIADPAFRDHLQNALRENPDVIAYTSGDDSLLYQRGSHQEAVRAAIDKFVHRYIGDAGRPVPFGGREYQLQELNDWLKDLSAPHYMLVASLPGRGKSALLVRWCDQLRTLGKGPDGRNVFVVFVPVSIRYELNTETAVLSSLVTRIAALHGEPVAVFGEAQEWRDRLIAYLRRDPPADATLLVVLDGLDEAAGWDAHPSLLPRDPAHNVKVVISARFTATRSSVIDWLSQFDWAASDARSLTVGRLSTDGIREVVAGMGSRLESAANSPEVIDLLAKLSEGDPLVLYLCVLDLWDHAPITPASAIERLGRVEPGLSGYMKR